MSFLFCQFVARISSSLIPGTASSSMRLWIKYFKRFCNMFLDVFMVLDKNITIKVDDREKKADVWRYLKEMGFDVLFERMDIADYVIGRNVGIERKSVNDFINSVIDKRLFEQATYLTRTFNKVIFIIEGYLNDVFRYRKFKKQHFFGAIAYLVSINSNVIFSSSSYDTALIISSLARRFYKTEKRRYLSPVKIRVLRNSKSVPIVQLNLISTIPTINIDLARKILLHFKTPRRFFKATSDELRKVPGLGDKRIKRILEILDTIYSENYGVQFDSSSQ